VRSTEAENRVHELFSAWSSADPSLVASYFHPDAVLRDTVNGEFLGSDAIRTLYEMSLEKWDDLTMTADRFWHGADGSVAFTWTMTGRVADNRLGESYCGAVATFQGMAYIVFEEGLVKEEIEFFDRAGAATSLGLRTEIRFV